LIVTGRRMGATKSQQLSVESRCKFAVEGTTYYIRYKYWL
jgi:hypothetical protein